VKPEGCLEKTMELLMNKKPLTVCYSGDSITVGANASERTEAPPFMPPWRKLVVQNLARYFGTELTDHNFAVGGKNTDYGVETAPELAEKDPDLVFIAFGMNDAHRRDIPGYTERIKTIMDTVLKTNPDAEFVLVSSMLGNADWASTPVEEFPGMRDALASLCGENAVLADCTEMWTDLLKVKKFHDLTGNGVNHPNDFGHRIYAQVILQLFVDLPV
jgi:lysophospholipase L1-like esterase